MFKFTLPALLLAASVSAYAADEVTLKDGTSTVSWADFVTAINNPNTIKGPTVTDDSPAVADEVKARNVAKGVLADKKAAVAALEGTENDEASTAENATLWAAKNALTAAQGVLTEKETALETANTNLQNYINGLKTAWDNLVGDLSTKKDELSSKQTQQSNLNTQLTQANSAVAAANTDLNNANAALTSATADYTKYSNQLNNLSKISVTVPWLVTISTAVTNYYNGWYNDDSNQKAYYILMTKKGITNLYLSFSENAPTWVPSTGLTWTSIAADKFDGEITNNSAVTIDDVYVYMGDDYSKLNNNDMCYNIATYTTKAKLLQSTKNAISSLLDNSKYQIQDYSESDKKTAEDLKEKIAAAEAAMEAANAAITAAQGKITTAQGKVDTISGQLTTIKEEIESLQTDIDTLNKTTIPAAKKKYEDAVAGTLEGDTQYNSLKQAVSGAQTDVDNAKTAVSTAETAVETAQAKVDAANADVETANNDYNAAQTALTNAIAAAQADADAAAKANYDEVELNADVTATVAINNFTGHLDGNDHVITVKADNLFKTFNGALAEVAINGKTYTTRGNNATFTNVARWSSEGGVYYGDGTTNNYESIAELGFAARSRFGVDIAKKALVYGTPETKVYSITVYSPNNEVQSYVNVVDGGFVGENGDVTIAENMFAKSATSDISTVAAIPANVFYVSGGNNVCKKVVINDRINFFCPVKIQAEEVSFDREFEKGVNSVCLPFPISKSVSNKIESLCTYDREGTDKFWFTKVEGEIAANIPILLMATGDFTLNLSNIAIDATDPSQIVRYQHDDASGLSFGTFKETRSGEFLGESQSSRIYALAKDGKFHPAAENTLYPFPSLRMIVAANETSSTESQSANPSQLPLRYIGIQDELGNVIIDRYDDSIIDEIISGVENVKSDASSISVTAGQGEIIITSESDYGQVAIYSLDGRMVAKVDVIAGTNNVNVQKGIYVVLGKKVMVK